MSLVQSGHESTQDSHGGDVTTSYESFEQWMDENEKDAYRAVTYEMDTVCTDTTSDALGVLLASPKFQLLLELFRVTYCWDSYIDLVCLLLRFTRATRE